MFFPCSFVHKHRENPIFFSSMEMRLHHHFYSYFGVDGQFLKVDRVNIWPDFIFIALGLTSIKIKAYSPDKAYHFCRLEARLGVGLIVSSYEDVEKESSVYMKIRIPCEGKTARRGFDSA